MRCTRGSIALAMLSHFFGLWYHDFGVDFPWLDRMKPNHRSTLPPFNILPCAPRPISTCGMLLSARKSCIMDRAFFDERTDGASASRSQSRHSPLTLLISLSISFCFCRQTAWDAGDTQRGPSFSPSIFMQGCGCSLFLEVNGLGMGAHTRQYLDICWMEEGKSEAAGRVRVI
jgi:hypothetical protein